MKLRKGICAILTAVLICSGIPAESMAAETTESEEAEYTPIYTIDDLAGINNDP